MKKYFYKTKFSFLCTTIDIDFCVCVFLVVKLVGELDVEFGRGIGAACAAGVKCFCIHYLLFYSLTFFCYALALRLMRK